MRCHFYFVATLVLGGLAFHAGVFGAPPAPPARSPAATARGVVTGRAGNLRSARQPREQLTHNVMIHVKGTVAGRLPVDFTIVGVDRLVRSIDVGTLEINGFAYPVALELNGSVGPQGTGYALQMGFGVQMPVASAAREGSFRYTVLNAGEQGTLQAGETLKIVNAAAGIDLEATITEAPGTPPLLAAPLPNPNFRNFRFVVRGVAAPDSEYDITALAAGDVNLVLPVSGVKEGPLETISLSLSLANSPGPSLDAVQVTYGINPRPLREVALPGGDTMYPGGRRLEGRVLVRPGQPIQVLESKDGERFTLLLEEIEPDTPAAPPSPVAAP